MPLTTEAEAETTTAAGVAAQHLPLAQPSLPSPYEEGERVIASHGQQLYEAKRWKRSWDEWVGADRLMKLTDENIQRMSHVNKQVADVKAGHLSPSKFGSRGEKNKKDPASMCCKRKRKQMAKVNSNECVEKFINISIPQTLKKQLMDDFESIKQMDKLVKLPRSPNVDDIINKYLEHRRKKDVVMSTSLGEVLSGLCAYFNKALPVMLLYNKERQQYQQAINENTSPSAVYGAEHLLRLFVKLPTLLHDLNIEEETLQNLQKNFHDFLKYGCVGFPPYF